MEDNKLTLKENSNSRDQENLPEDIIKEAVTPRNRIVGNLKLKADNNNTFASKASEQSIRYNKIIKMMGSRKDSSLTEKQGNAGTLNLDKVEINASNPLGNLLKAYEKQREKEKEEGANIVDQLRNKLNDFEKEIGKSKEEDENDDEEDSKKVEKRPERKHQLVNMLPKKEVDGKMLKNRIFWTKEKMHRVREKFFSAKRRIDSKTEEDFSHIRRWVEDGDTEAVISTLLNEHFKAFYKLEIKKQGILEFMLECNKPEMVKKVMEDEFYTFNYDFVFEKIGSLLKQRDKGLDIDTEEAGILFDNIIMYNLYNPSHVKMLLWFMGSFNFFHSFRNLIQKHEGFDEILEEYNQFELDTDIIDYIESAQSFTETIICCLNNNLQHLATALLVFKQDVRDKLIIDHAIINNSLMFLKFIWEKANQDNERKSKSLFRNSYRNKEMPAKDRSKSMLHIQFNISHNSFNNGVKIFTLSELIKKFARCIPSNTAAIHDIISNWKYIDKDDKILEALFDVRCFDEISSLIFRMKGKWELTKEQFQILIEQGELDLILYYLKIRECRTILYESSNQQKIVHNYIKYGEKMYYGAEMLAYISIINWNMELTNDLLKFIEKSLKKKSILKCHSPILTCLLLCEFIVKIGDASVQYKVYCDRIVKQLSKFAHSIQEANSEEKYIKYMMTQKDTRGRSSYQIASENNFYSVLQTAEVGTLVQKMWNGRLSHNGLLEFSSLYKYTDSTPKISQNPFESFESFDSNKTYFHQLRLWTESSQLRYWQESLSTILLIILYNLFIYILVVRTTEDQAVKVLMKPIGQLDTDLRLMAYTYIFWTVCIALNIPLQFLFGYLSERRYRLDRWGWIDIGTIIFAFLLLLDTTKIFPNYDSQGKLIPSDGKSDNSFVLRAVILSINDAFVWLRVTGIFLTFKNLGPLIRMIYLLSLKTLKYLVVFAIFFAGGSAVFVMLFYNSSEQFSSFSVAFTNLFNCFLANPNVFDFTDYLILGAILVTIFTTISGILLMYILIAVLSSEYEVLSEIVDAAHRAVLITYYRRFKWHDKYGYLIFLTTPLNILNFIVLPFSLCFDKKKFNTFISRIYFSLFYLPMIIAFQIVFCLILSPLCYIKGVIMMINHQFNHAKSNLFKGFFKWLGWVIFGFPFLLIMIFRDLVLQLYVVFDEKEEFDFYYQKRRIRNFITKDDIATFIQFIHGRSKNEPNDMHNLFLDYLAFDQDKKAEIDANMKERSIYLQKLRSASGYTMKKTLQTLVGPNHTNSQKGSSGEEANSFFSNNTQSIIKRNLIIIEILENFLIDDGSDNFIIDVEKMKMMLPKTMNINNSYFKRLINTDIKSLNRAINKLKTKKNKFMQNRLLNKISGATIRLDHVVDNLSKVDPLENNKKFHSEVEENEDDFYIELQNLLNRITNDVHNSVKTAKKKIEIRASQIGKPITQSKILEVEEGVDTDKKQEEA